MLTLKDSFMTVLAHPNKIAFATFGCRTNQHDTAEMQMLLESDGFTVVDIAESADVYVVNTCTVTSNSDYSARLAVRKALVINENALVVFTGCYAQTNPGETARLPGVDLLLGNADKLNVVEAIRTKLRQPLHKNGAAEIRFSDINEPQRRFAPLPVSKFPGKDKAFIKVQTGCDEKCSFCTVVLARGKALSDSRDNVLNNVRAVIAAGYKEITLTGINLGTYGMDMRQRESFSSLAADVLNLPGDFRIRLSSINPMEVDDRLIDLLAGHPKLCPHLHIPLQSGDDHILRRMRRNYDSRQYRQTVARILDKIPDVALGADVMVGFPGETPALFQNTRCLVEDLPFSYLHVFGYSHRKGTESANFKDDVPGDLKRERNRILTELAKQKAREFRARFLHQTVQVLIETARDAKTGCLRGLSERFIPVQTEGDDQLKGRIVPVTIKTLLPDRVAGWIPS
jgi:threonylcarbamoyladenosine tRNA methylthiotransferase MtaB